MTDEPEAPPVAKWVVINTHPHREHVAIEHLERQGFVVYCPRVIKRIRHARRSVDAPRPMFPGYIFAFVERSMMRWRPITSTIGVRNLVRFGDQLAFLDEDFIATLRRREVDGIIARTDAPFSIGESVRIAGGPFDGLVAKIVEMKEKDRLIVLMELLNGQVKVKVDGFKLVAL